MPTSTEYSHLEVSRTTACQAKQAKDLVSVEFPLERVLDGTPSTNIESGCLTSSKLKQAVSESSSKSLSNKLGSLSTLNFNTPSNTESSATKDQISESARDSSSSNRELLQQALHKSSDRSRKHRHRSSSETQVKDDSLRRLKPEISAVIRIPKSYGGSSFEIDEDSHEKQNLIRDSIETATTSSIDTTRAVKGEASADHVNVEQTDKSSHASIKRKYNSKKLKTKKRKESGCEGDVPLSECNGKPKRPLSAYNFFFRDERARIIADKKASGDLDVVSPANSNRVYPKHKTPHRKISFESLGKLIASRWKALDEPTRQRYHQMAEQDSDRYRAEMKVFYERENAKRRAKYFPSIKHGFSQEDNTKVSIKQSSDKEKSCSPENFSVKVPKVGNVVMPLIGSCVNSDIGAVLQQQQQQQVQLPLQQNKTPENFLLVALLQQSLASSATISNQGQPNLQQDTNALIALLSGIGALTQSNSFSGGFQAQQQPQSTALPATLTQQGIVVASPQNQVQNNVTAPQLMGNSNFSNILSTQQYSHISATCQQPQADTNSGRGFINFNQLPQILSQSQTYPHHNTGNQYQMRDQKYQQISHMEPATQNRIMCTQQQQTQQEQQKQQFQQFIEFLSSAVNNKAIQN